MVQQNEIAEKNFNYIKYSSFRYSLALFLFTNMIWLFMHFAAQSFAIFIPLISVLGIGLSMFEQMKVYGKEEYKESYLKYTKKYFFVQICVNGLNLIALIFTPIMTWLFPLFSTQGEVKLVLAVINIIGLAISLFNFKKIIKMDGSDKNGYR